MKVKNIVFSGAMASILMMGAATATVDGKDVNFNGEYELTSGAKGNATVAPVSNNYKYDYTTTSGSQTDVVNTTDPDKSLFTYTAAAGSTATNMNTTHLQSDYTGNTEADDNIVKTTQDIVSGATIDSSKYTYQDAQNSANYIIFDTDARTLEDTVTLDSDFTSGSITLKADSTAEGTKESTFNGEMYQFTYQESEDSQEYRYKLSADGTKLINIDLSEEVTTPVNGLDTLFAAAKHAYTTDKVAVDAAIADLIIDQDTENTNHGKAAEAITKDTATIASLDVDWGTYQAAAGLLKDAQDAQAAAKQVFADDSAAYTTANGIYTAPITDTIDTRANDAIVASLEEGGAINEAVTQGVTAVYNQAHEWAETVTGLEDDGTGAANQLRKALTKLETEDEITNTIESKNFAGALHELDGDIQGVRAEATDAIDAEASTRAAADTTLQNNIDNEATRAMEEEAAIRSEFAAADELTLSSAKAFANAGDELTLSKANAYTDAKVDTLEKNVSGGIAAATALSAVEVSNVKRGEMSVGGGYGYYNGASAGAFGMALGLSDNWSVNAGAGIASGDETQVSFRAGTNYKFKLF